MPEKKVSRIEAVNGNLIALLDDGEAYGFVVFCRTGQPILEITDRVICSATEGDLFVYKTSGSYNIYTVHLPKL